MIERASGAPPAAPGTGVRVRELRPEDAEPLKAVMRRAFDPFDWLPYSTRGRKVLGLGPLLLILLG